MAEHYHYKGEGLRAKDRFRKQTVENVGTDFRLVFHPVDVLRAGLSGSSEKGVDPLTGKLVPLGNPVMLPESKVQWDVVLVEDAVTGNWMEVVGSQAEGHKIIKLIRNKRQPRPEPVGGVHG